MSIYLTSCRLVTQHESPNASENLDLHSQQDKKNQTTESEKQLVDTKYSLAKDRSEFDKLRNEIPVDVKKTNDEKALFAEWFSEDNTQSSEYRTPESIQDKYQVLVRKKRDLFSKDMSTLREKFNKEETRKRNDFLKKLDEQRKSFVGEKSKPEKKKEFFDDLDIQRKTFFSEQKDKREEFESLQIEKRKNFEDYLKEKNNYFYSELKNYRMRMMSKKKN